MILGLSESQKSTMAPNVGLEAGSTERDRTDDEKTNDSIYTECIGYSDECFVSNSCYGIVDADDLYDCTRVYTG